MLYILHKRSVRRRQSRDTNRNIKWSVYWQYGWHSLTFRALALRQRETLDYTIRIGSTVKRKHKGKTKSKTKE